MEENKKYWNLQDIMNYLGCGKNTASMIRNIAITQFNGLCFYDKRKLKKDAVIKTIEYLEERG